MSEDRFANCSAAKLWSLLFDIRDGIVVKEEIELAMEYYCYLWETDQAAPYELYKLINAIFSKYLERKDSGGTLEAAFGFKGKQGFQDLYRRNEDIATDVARYYLQRSSIRSATIRSATLIVAGERNLKTSTIEEAWRHHKVEGIIRVRLELKSQGTDFTPGQIKKACKIIDPINRKIQAITGINPER